VEFVANKSDHEFHEFHENDDCHLDIIGLQYNFFKVSQAALVSPAFNCTLPSTAYTGTAFSLM